MRSEAQEQTLQGGASQGAPRAETPPPGHAGSPLLALWGPVDPVTPLNRDPQQLQGPLTLVTCRLTAFCRDQDKPRSEKTPRTAAQTPYHLSQDMGHGDPERGSRGSL